MKKSKILKEAREIIKSGQEDFVCIALQLVSERHNYEPTVDTRCQELIDWIRKLLGKDSYTLENWLRKHHKVDANYGSKKLLRTRLAWIDWMILQCKIEEKRIYVGPWGLKKCKKR